MFRKSENGQAIIILAIAAVVLIGFAAVAIDAGNAYTARRQAQNAADAAAMAGARQLVLECGKQDQVLNDPGYAGAGSTAANIVDQVNKMSTINAEGATVSVSYIDVNGAVMGPVQPPVPCTCATGAKGVEVVVQAKTTSFLAGLMGQADSMVEARAKARYGQITMVTSGLYPITRRMPSAADQIVPGQEIEIRDEKAGPGNFGWLSWAGSPSAPVLKFSMTPPGDSHSYVNPHDANDHTLNLYDWVQGATGNMATLSSILDQYWVNKDPMIIPLFDSVEGQGSNFNYRVAGFAALQITGYQFGGNNKHIDAKFVKWIVNGDWSPNVTCSEESGLYSVKLIP